MQESETHRFTAPCAQEFRITKSGGHYSLVVGNPGEKCHILLEIIGKLISELPKEKQLEILFGTTVSPTDPKDRGYICEKGYAGNKSCIHRLYRFIKEGK